MRLYRALRLVPVAAAFLPGRAAMVPVLAVLIGAVVELGFAVAVLVMHRRGFGPGACGRDGAVGRARVRQSAVR